MKILKCSQKTNTTLLIIWIMNKLVIIGNGFDLAHGLPTKYEDFMLWVLRNGYIKFKEPYSNKVESVQTILSITRKSLTNDINTSIYDYIAIKELIDDFKRNGLKINCQQSFVEHLYEEVLIKNWVDIEKDYYEQLKMKQTDDDVENLNIAMDNIKEKLSYYLSKKIETPTKNRNITNHFKRLLHTDDSEFSSLMVLNFNYTNTVEKYVGKRQVNYIHGKLNDKKNPIIFGYGDETDKRYKEFEDLEKNEYLKHMKSFAYLQTPNYRKLFNFLDAGAFEIHIMGHSLGVSDRLLFTHIFEHENFNSVKIYYYEYLNKEQKVVENDFFEKTQNLSRYFRLDSKHKMRTKVVPFNESQPLTPFKLQN